MPGDINGSMELTGIAGTISEEKNSELSLGSISDQTGTIPEKVNNQKVSISISDIEQTIPEAEYRMSNRFKIGSVLGSYILEKKIGSGSFGEVWKSRELDTGKTFALKILYKSSSLKQCINEPKVLGRLKHPNIVELVESKYVDEWFVIVMELVNGKPLSNVIQCKCLTLQETVKIISQIAQGIKFAHDNGVVHRDIKPENIIVENRTGKVKIADFGVSRLHVFRQTKPAIAGSYAYMSPEQFRGRVSYESDIWALGVITYQLIFAQKPFDGKDLWDLAQKITVDRHLIKKTSISKSTEQIIELIDQMLVKDFRQRININEVIAKLMLISNNENIDVKVGSITSNMALRKSFSKIQYILPLIGALLYGFRSAVIIILLVIPILVILVSRETIGFFLVSGSILLIFCLYLLFESLEKMLIKKVLKRRLLKDPELIKYYKLCHDLLFFL